MNNQDLFLQRALLDEGLLDHKQLESVRLYAVDHHMDFADALIKTETISGRQLAMIRSDVCEVPYIDLSDYEPCYGNASILPRNLAERHCAFPLFKLNGVLTIVMDDPLNLDATDQIRQLVKCEVDAVLSDRDQIKSLIAKIYSMGQEQTEAASLIEDLDTASVASDEDQPVVMAVNQILGSAIQQRASDIHINPDDRHLHLRYRIDGVLHEQQGPPLSMHAGLVQRLKVMARLDLTQSRRPQDGKFRIRHAGQNIDIRLSIIPTVVGMNVVMRLLNNAQTFDDFHSLGMPPDIVGDIEEAINHPYGMLLVTGPTGSGKTTTLFTALSRLNDPSRNIMTIEDPVEIRLPYIRQIQVNTEIGLTFASALRSILRQDPDVILVGEVRDDETATIAIQSALTGHLVMSTLHTNDAVGAVSRLRDYHIPPFIINSAVLGVLAQRLVRRVCPHCSTTDTPDELTCYRFKLDQRSSGYVHGQGCNQCSHTGYRGRVGLYEYLKFTPGVKHLIESGAATAAIREYAANHGMRMMWQDGLDKAGLGQTTLSEVSKTALVVDMSPQEHEQSQSA